MSGPDSLYFRCRCGWWSRSLDAFYAHALPCHRERERAQDLGRVLAIRRHSQARSVAAARYPDRMGHYQARMLGYLPWSGAVPPADQATHAQGERQRGAYPHTRGG